MAEIFVCPKGSISNRSVRALRDVGIVVVQADDPDKCRFIRAGVEVESRDLLWAAMKAMQLKPAYSAGEGAAKVREEFAKVVFGIIDSRRELAKAVDDATSGAPPSVDAVDPHVGSTTG